MAEIPSHEQASKAQAKSIVRMSALPIAISVAAGVATALFQAQVGIGIVAGLVVAVISLQIQLMAHLAGTDLEAQIQLKALKPMSDLRRLNKATADSLIQLAEAQVRYLSGPHRPVVFDLELEHRRAMLVEQYDECARGTMRLNLRPASILRETDGVSTVNSELKATSAVPPVAYWNSPSGLSYLEQQNGMLEQGIRIKRVFIQDRSSLEDLSDVMARHLSWRGKFGVDKLDVRVAFIETLADNLVADYAIVDQSSVIKLETQLGLNQPVAVTWDTSPASVERASRMFDRLWASGVDPSALPVFDQLTL